MARKIPADAMRAVVAWLDSGIVRALANNASPTALRDALKKANLSALKVRSFRDSEIDELLCDAIEVHQRQAAINRLAAFVKGDEIALRSLKEAAGDARGELRFLIVMLESPIAERFVSKREAVLAILRSAVRAIESIDLTRPALPSVVQMDEWYQHELEQFDIEAAEHIAATAAQQRAEHEAAIKRDEQMLEKLRKPRRGRPNADDLDITVHARLVELGATVAEANSAIHVARNTVSKRKKTRIRKA